jgi:hypothetical protein
VVDCFRNGAEPDTALLQSGNCLDEVCQAATKPVQFPNDQHIAGARIVHCLSQSGSIGARPGSPIFKHLGATGGGERVALQCQVFIESPDPRVPNLCHEDLSVFPSYNHFVRRPIYRPGFPDIPDAQALAEADGEDVAEEPWALSTSGAHIAGTIDDPDEIDDRCSA